MTPDSKRIIPEFSDNDFKVSSFTGEKAYCVAVAHKNGVVGVRDSNNPDKGTIFFDIEEWEVFIKGVKKGEFDFTS